jgi:hypothetical protein
MSAEAIAKVVKDIKKSKTEIGFDDRNTVDLCRYIAQKTETVVDGTPVYKSLLERHQIIDLYGDHPCIAPPWDSAFICYVNRFKNVVVINISATAYKKGVPNWETENEVDWSRVKWVTISPIYFGGYSKSLSKPIATSGPLLILQSAIYENGEPADLRWIEVDPRVKHDELETAQLVCLGVLNFCNCRNIELVEPKRPFPVRRRLREFGINVKTINVKPIGRSTKSKKGEIPAVGCPLTPVRGHFASYGPQYDRGLLFGKYEGRFWIPQHARGSAEFGLNLNDYQVGESA